MSEDVATTDTTNQLTPAPPAVEKPFVLPVDEKWIENILVPKSAKGKVELHQIDYTVIGKGMGFSSNIVLTKLEWKGTEPEIIAALPTSIILKVATAEKMLKLTGELIAGANDDKTHQFMEKDINVIVHKTECEFYDFIAHLQKENTDKCLVLPRLLKIYHTQKIAPGLPGIIVMEDASQNGKVVDLSQSFLNLQQVLNMTSELAKLHAFCWKYPKKWKAYGFMTNQRELFGELKKMMPVFYNKLASEFELNFTIEQLERFTSFTEIIDFLEKQNSDMDQSPSVIVHGDWWAHNIMFKFDQSSPNHVKDEVYTMVDWQIAHIGSCMEDLARLLASSVSTDLRRQHYQSIIKHYYDTVCSLLSNDRSLIPLTIDQMIKEYKFFFGAQAGISIVFAMVIELLPFQDEKEKARRKLEMVRLAEANIMDANQYKDEA